jgi:hypothetical protein
MPRQPDEMDRARAAREALDALGPGRSAGRGPRSRAQGEMDAFMAIFHPEKPRIMLEEDGRGTD